MLLLDIYEYIEGKPGFTIRELMEFMNRHEDTPNIARQAQMKPSHVAVCSAIEFFGRAATLGYIDINNGVASVRRPIKRPFGYQFEVFEGMQCKRVKMIYSLKEGVGDDEFFNEK